MTSIFNKYPIYSHFWKQLSYNKAKELIHTSNDKLIEYADILTDKQTSNIHNLIKRVNSYIRQIDNL